MENLPIVFSVAFIAACILYSISGVYILRINRRSALNRVSFAICIALCIWSLGFAFSISAPNIETSLFWRRFAAFGWSIVYALILHCILILTGRNGFLKKKWPYLLLYAPAAACIYAFALPNQMDFVQYNLILTNTGWVNSAANTGWDWFYGIYYGSYFLAGVALVWIWGESSLDIRVKKQARLIAGSFLAAVLIGTATDMVLNPYFSLNIPQLAPLIIVLPIAVVNYSISHYGLMRPKAAYEEESILDVSSRAVLYNYVSAVAVVGSLANIIFGYIYKEPDMGSVYLFSLILLVFGAAVEIVRRLNIKDGYKDIINIIIIAAAIPFVTLHFTANASLTIWAFPIIVIVFSLVFNKRFVLVTLSSSILATQAVVWIITPYSEVTIDAEDHIIRLGILGAAIFVAFCVNRVYIARLNENKRQIDLQKNLSQISAELVRVNETTLEGTIHSSLERIGRFTGMDRIFIMMFDLGQMTMTYRYEWCNEGMESGSGSFYNVPFERYPWLIERIWANDTLKIRDMQELSSEAHFEMLELMSFDASATVIVPIRSKDKFFGFISASTREADKEMPAENLLMFEVISNIFSGAFAKVEGEKTVNEMAFYDPLTKLPNRSLFKDRMAQAIYLAQRTDRMVGILFLDLDSFKNVNDTLGHEGGDELLKSIAKELMQKVRKSDSVSRFGGDEFLIMINNLSGPEDIIRIVDSIMGLFNKNFKINQQEFFVTASAGIAIYPVDGRDTETLIKNADIAMYNAKARGKGQYVLCTESMKQKVQERMKIANLLYRALSRGELEVYYQPQVSLKSGKVVGVEALLRWNHPEMGMISPRTFIPLAEQAGLINNMGAWVLKTACLQNKKWQQMGLPRVRMAVNISVNQFRNPEMVQQVKTILAETGLAPEYLELEITESVAVNESDYIINVLSGLKNAGISIAMDDFGTEYSSLSRLKLLPIDRLKMDMQFVQGIESNSKDQAIAKVIISLAKNLGLKVIAEGVETEIQKSFLWKNGCDEAQGYFFYRPMPAEEAEAALRSALQ